MIQFFDTAKGGIDNDNALQCRNMGADILVAGKLCIFRDKGQLENKMKGFVPLMATRQKNKDRVFHIKSYENSVFISHFIILAARERSFCK